MSKSTVVIPNYNGIKYIEACLESLMIGTITDFKIIIVDNASKDGSLELIKEKFPNIKLIENSENTGFCKAVNQGILASDTEYVILLNNDTRVDKLFIHELEKIMDSDDRIFSASAKLVSLYDKTKIDDAGDFYCALGWAFAQGKGKHPDKYNKVKEIFASCGGGAIYRRKLLVDNNGVGLFDENHFAYLEDIDIGYRARIKGYKNVFVPSAIVYHAGSATSGSRYNEFKTKLASKNSVYIIFKNMPFIQILINLPLLVAGFFIKTLFFMKKGFGKIYINGLINGIILSFSEEGQKHRQKFEIKNMGNYIKIQIELWINMFRLLNN